MKLSKFTKEFLHENNIVPILLLFLVWRVWTLAFAYLGFVLLPIRGENFFGGGFDRYFYNPPFWAWSNFDGEHYVSIAQSGYKFLEHSFFPLYPLILHLISPLGLLRITWTGLLVSNLAFFVSLVLLWRLARLDYSPKVSWCSLVALVCFPTSFYFGSVYTGSIFLLFTLTSFLLARKKAWLASGVFGAFASAARVFGVALAPALFVESWLQHRKNSLSARAAVSFLIAGLVLSGVFLYMLYLAKTTGNPFSFYSELSPFGQQRSVGRIILFPQVFWRYFKMIATVDRTSSLYFTALVEFFASLLVLFLLVRGWLTHLRLSYWTFMAGGYLLATSTGSFSSLPRYVLILFPLFLLLGQMLAGARKCYKVITLASLIILLAVETMFFVRGYWVG